MNNSSKKKNRGRRATSATPATQTIEIVVPRSKAPARKGKGRKRTQRIRTQRPVQPVLKECSVRYMKCLLDPFSMQKEEMPCIPDLYDMPSFKTCTLQRGQFATGTQGVAFISAAPQTVQNSLPNIAYSLTTFTGNTFPDTSAALPGTVATATNTGNPFTAATTPNSRVVACGLRVRYIGTELDRAGVIIPMRATGYNDELDGMDFTQCLSRPNTSSFPVDRRWHGTVWIPFLPEHYEWKQWNGAINTTTTRYQQMGIMVTGAKAGVYNFEWEYVQYIEAIPRNDAGAIRSVPNQTKSHSDVTGFGAIRDFVGGLTASDMGQSALQAGFRAIKAAAAAYSPAAGLLLEGSGRYARVSGISEL